MHYPDNTNLSKIKKFGFRYVRKEKKKRKKNYEWIKRVIKNI